MGAGGERRRRVGGRQPVAGGKAGETWVGVEADSPWRVELESVSCGPQIQAPLFLSNRGSGSQPEL